MFRNVTYLVWLALCMGVPLLALLIWRDRLWRQRRALVWTLVGAGVGGWLWDGFAVRIGLWTYDPAHLSGIWFLGLPLEEWLWIGGMTLLFGGVTVVLKEAELRKQEVERLGD